MSCDGGSTAIAFGRVYVLSLLYPDLELKDYLFVVSLLNPYLNSRYTLQSSYL